MFGSWVSSGLQSSTQPPTCQHKFCRPLTGGQHRPCGSSSCCAPSSVLCPLRLVPSCDSWKTITEGQLLPQPHPGLLLLKTVPRAHTDLFTGAQTDTGRPLHPLVQVHTHLTAFLCFQVTGVERKTRERRSRAFLWKCHRSGFPEQLPLPRKPSPTRCLSWS